MKNGFIQCGFFYIFTLIIGDIEYVTSSGC